MIHLKDSNKSDETELNKMSNWIFGKQWIIFWIWSWLYEINEEQSSFPCRFRRKCRTISRRNQAGFHLNFLFNFVTWNFKRVKIYWTAKHTCENHSEILNSQLKINWSYKVNVWNWFIYYKRLVSGTGSSKLLLLALK